MAIALPPPQFDIPFIGRVIEDRAPYFSIDAICRNRGARFNDRIEGCAWRFSDALSVGNVGCHIIIPDEDSENIRRHEIGHCNGWPKSHPGAHF